MAIKLGEKDLFAYLGDYHPVNIYKGEHKVSGWKWAEQSGEELHFENTYNDFTEVEIDGKSYQHAGSGKNLFNVKLFARKLLESQPTAAEYTTLDGRNVLKVVKGSNDVPMSIKVKPNTQYILNYFRKAESVVTVGSAFMRFTYKDGTRQHVTVGEGDGWSNRTTIFNTGNNDEITGVTILFWQGGIVYLDLDSFQLEEGSTATSYEPPAPTPDYPVEIHSLNNFDIVSSVEKLTEEQLEEYDYDIEYDNIYKINLSLSEPLRSVGDVKDRLFRDSDELWKVERNVELIYPEDGTRTVEETYGMLESPIYEQLSQEYQDKLNNLRSFRDSNYVYTTGSINPHLIGRAKVKDV